eukprot:5410189-Prymnesium_polylepis.1
MGPLHGNGHHQGWRQPPHRVTESCTGHIPAGVATWPSARLIEPTSLNYHFRRDLACWTVEFA